MDLIEHETGGVRGIRRPLILCIILLVCIAALGILGRIAVRPPAAFPVGKRIEIPYDTSLQESARILERERAVRSALLLQFLLIGQSAGNGVKAGVYQFDEPLGLFAIADAITSGTHGAPLVHITIPEGLRNAEIDAIVHEALPRSIPGAFAAAAQGKEGYLFPDTYHLPETAAVEEIVLLMEETFDERLAVIAPLFASSTRSKTAIITMASILEREANDVESMSLVAGILWKRLDAGIPLQVDASFSYLLGKESKEVTEDDLRIDSPYNTYRYQGLPPTPLNNPGLAAITAALSPAGSPYFYYLTDPDGVFHYARTYKEHLENKRQYLDGK